MIFSQYKETCEIFLDYPKIGEEDIKYYVKKSIRNLLRANIDVHSRRLIAEFPVDGVKLLSKLQSHCVNMTFADRIRYDRLFQQATQKGMESASNYINRFQNVQALYVSVGKSHSEDQFMYIFLDNFHQGGKYTAYVGTKALNMRHQAKNSF